MVRMPSYSEDDYIARLEFEKKKKAQREKQRLLAAAERKRLKELHHMKCPKCGMELIEVDYERIRIDKCSSCDGVWLDAGELDAVQKIEKSSLGRLLRVVLKG